MTYVKGPNMACVKDWKTERTSDDFDRGTLRLVTTVEETRDEIIEWAEKGIPQGTRWETILLLLTKTVAWLCIKQMQRDAQRERRYGR